MGSDSGGDDCESLATLLVVAIAAIVTRKPDTLVVEAGDSHRPRHVVVVDARD